MHRYLLIFILSMINLFLILFIIGDFNNLIYFALSLSQYNFSIILTGLLELIGYYFVSFIIIYLSSVYTLNKGISIVNIFLFLIICFLLDIVCSFFIYGIFFMV